MNKLLKIFETAFQGQVYTWDETKEMMVSKQVDTASLVELPIYFTHAQMILHAMLIVQKLCMKL